MSLPLARSVLGRAFACLLYAGIASAGPLEGPVEVPAEVTPKADSEDAGPAPALGTGEDEYNELYQKLFGQPPPDKHYDLNAELLIDGRRVGNARVLIPLYASEMRVEAEALLNALAEVLLPEPYRAVVSQSDGKGFLSSTALRELGFEVSFSQRQMRFEIATPAEQRRVAILSLEGVLATPPPGTFLQPAKISAYLNTTWRGALEDSRRTAGQSMVGVFNYSGWVSRLESSYESTLGGFEIERVRLHRDDLDRGLRYSGGTLSVPSIAPESGDDILGLRVSSISALAFYERPAPRLREVVVLPERGQIDITINGRSRRHYDLPAGRYELRDFPLARGLNAVEIRARAGGRELTRRSSSLVWQQEFLRPKEIQYSASLGFPLDPGRAISISSNQPLLSGLLRFGVSPKFTAGTYGKANGERQSFGASGIFATRVGSLQIDAGLSHLESESVEGAARLLFRNFSSGRSDSLISSYQFSLAGQTPGFGRSQLEQPRRRERVAMSGFLGLYLSRRNTARVRVFFRENAGSFKNSYGLGLAALHRFSTSLRLSAGFEWKRDAGGGLGLLRDVPLELLRPGEAVSEFA